MNVSESNMISRSLRLNLSYNFGKMGENVKKAKAEAEARGLDISVYDKMNNFGHAESSRTKPMFEIPFILWTSPDFSKNKSLLKHFPSFPNKERFELKSWKFSL